MRSRSEEANETYAKEELVQRREVALVGEALNEDGERRDGRGVLRARRGVVGVSTLHVAHEQKEKERQGRTCAAASPIWASWLARKTTACRRGARGSARVAQRKRGRRGSTAPSWVEKVRTRTDPVRGRASPGPCRRARPTPGRSGGAPRGRLPLPPSARSCVCSTSDCISCRSSSREVRRPPRGEGARTHRM